MKPRWKQSGRGRQSERREKTQGQEAKLPDMRGNLRIQNKTGSDNTSDKLKPKRSMTEDKMRRGNMTLTKTPDRNNIYDKT